MAGNFQIGFDFLVPCYWPRLPAKLNYGGNHSSALKYI